MSGGVVFPLLKLALLLQATGFSITIVNGQENPSESQDVTTPPGEGLHEPEESSFLDSLVRPGTDMIATFSLELLEDLHQHSLECRMELSSVDMKYSKLMNKLVKYYHSMEKVVSMPQFAEVSNKDRTQVEANFHGAIKHMEKTRNEELKKIQARCNSTEQDWLSEKFVSAVYYAKKVLLRDRQEYKELIAEMKTYRAKMLRHIAACQHSEHSFGQLYCYLEELETLLYLLDNFLEVMRNIDVMYYGDDEDLVEQGQGSGVGEVTTDAAPDTTQPPLPTTSKVIKIKLPPGFFGVGPVIFDPRSDAAASPTTSQATPTRETTLVTHTSDISAAEPSSTPSPAPPANSEAEQQGSRQSTPAEVSVTRSPSQPPTDEDSTEMLATSTSPHSQAVPWLDDAFEEVLSLRDPPTDSTRGVETPGEEDSSRSNKKTGDNSAPSGSKTSKRRPSEMPRPPRPDKVPRPPSVDIEVQGSYDGNEVDLTLEVGDHSPERPNHAPERPDHTHNRPDHAHGKPIVEGVILDPLDPQQQQEDKKSWSYTYSILTFFFLTLGVVAIAFAVIIITIVSINRVNQRRRGQKVSTPVLSEKEMLEAMKKTGYVNPTYKFYTQQS